MDTTFILTNVFLADQTEPVDVQVSDGVIEAITPGGTAAGQQAKPSGPMALQRVDGKGGLVLPALCDLHVHLDLAYSLDLVPPNQSGTLLEAIQLWDKAKASITAENTTERAIQAIQDEVNYGTGHIRAHVDVGGSAGTRLAEGVIAARDQTNHLCDIQLVAFPQDGLIRDPHAVENIRQAMRMGVDLVGGIPHVERTAAASAEHIRMVLELAREFDADVDVHIDETDDPNSLCVEVLASETIKAGWQGRVTASHVCALASYDHVHAVKVIGLIKEAGITVVTNPQVNLHLQGRQDRYPKRRGLTRVSELLAAGVPVAAGQDCIKDPFYPLGTGNMLDVAHTLIHADHLAAPRQMRQVLDTITIHPAVSIGVPKYGVVQGYPANFVVFPTSNWPETVRLRPRPLHVFREGRRVNMGHR